MTDLCKIEFKPLCMENLQKAAPRGYDKTKFVLKNKDLKEYMRMILQSIPIEGEATQEDTDTSIFGGTDTKTSQQKTYIIQASSAGFEGGNYAKISINNIPVRLEQNKSLNMRGLHLVIINPSNGNIEFSKVFDTYSSSTDIDHFIFNNTFPEGHIVVAACKDDCVSNLSDTAKVWFSSMGSEEIWKLQYRQGFAFVAEIGRRSSKMIENKSYKNIEAMVTYIALIKESEKQ